MKILSYCLMLVFAVVMVACTGTDTETIVKQTQCHDETIVTGDETCPEPVVMPTPQGTTPNDDDEDTNRGDSRCTTQVKGPQTHEGSSGDDNICGDDAANTIEGRDGRDTIRGGKGNDKLYGDFIVPDADDPIGDDDKLYGEEGDDELFGGIGRDLLDGGPGDDLFKGGKGDDNFIGGAHKNGDTVEYASSATADIVVDLAQGFGTDEYGDQDEYEGIENVRVTGPGAENEIIGDANANVLEGITGTFTIRAGAGNDVVNISKAIAATGTDTIDGGGGIDTLIVDEETTINATDPYTRFENLKATEDSEGIPLLGDVGPNKLIGGPGATTFTGNGGADTFVIKKGEGNDTIADFSIEQGDKVYLCGFSGTSKKTAKEDTENTVQIDGEQEIVFTANDGFSSFTVPPEPELASDADDAARTEYNNLVAARKIQTDNAKAVINKISNRSESSCE